MCNQYTDCPIALVVEGDQYNYISRGITYYLNLSEADRLSAQAKMEARLETTRRAFLGHRSVPWFLGASFFLAGAMLSSWGRAPTVLVLICVVLMLASGTWMMRGRKSLFDGLVYLRGELAAIAAAHAIHAAEIRGSR